MKRSERIRERLEQVLQPLQMRITDESAHHSGHEGIDGTGESHFRVEILSKQFEGRTSVERHRMVYKALDGLFDEGLHALQIVTKAPGE